MRTLGDIQTNVLVKANMSTTLAFLTDTILNDFIDDAHKFCSGYKKWPFTEGRVSTTFASLVTDEDGILVGEYPEGWKSDSIRRLSIGGKRVDKKEFYKFHEFLEDFLSDTDRIYSDHGRRYYINPNIDISGTVTAWGQYTPATIDRTDLTSITVFEGEQEGNEAIIEETLSYIENKKKDLPKSIAHHKRATDILDGLWERIQGEQYGYQLPDGDGMFERFDVLEGAMRDDLFKRDQFN